MLFQPAPRTSFVKRMLAFVAGTLASLLRSHADTGYLGGLRPDELEDLGLRRSEDGNYRFFN